MDENNNISSVSMDNTQASVMAYLPKEEKALFGFLTYKQAMLISLGVISGFIAFWLVKFLLGFFTSFLDKWIYSLIVWIVVIIPFAYIALKPVRSINDNGLGVVLYPQYKQMIINYRAKDEHGTYLNYHYNHPVLSKGKSVCLSNETTTYYDDEQ